MFSRLFTPVAVCRLFDPMPLPRRVKMALSPVRIGRNNAPEIKTYSLQPMKVTVRKIQLYR
jgi:hypothetical protein